MVSAGRLLSAKVGGSKSRSRWNDEYGEEEEHDEEYDDDEAQCLFPDSDDEFSISSMGGDDTDTDDDEDDRCDIDRRSSGRDR